MIRGNPSMRGGPARGGSLHAFFGLSGLILVMGMLLAVPVRGEISPFFPEAARLGDATGDPPAIPVFRGDEQIGLLFETRHVTPIPAYSGLPVNMLVGLDMQGEITGVRVIEHSEPIMLVGIPESRLADFVNQYVTRTVSDRVRVGLSPRQREGYTYVDAVSGATVTVVVMGESIMRGARMMAVAHGLVAPGAGAAEPARVRTGDFEPADWETLLSTGAVAHRLLTRGEVDAAFVGTEAEHVDRAPPGAETDTFIHLYAAYLNAPTVGRNLLGEALHRQLMERLEEGEHAIMLMAEGIYSFKGSGFVRGGIFDRIQLLQAERAFQFRDTDLIRAPRLALDGVPRFGEREIFVVRAEHGFDPGRPWEIELLVRRQVGALDSAFVNFSLEYLPLRLAVSLRRHAGTHQRGVPQAQGAAVRAPLGRARAALVHQVPDTARPVRHLPALHGERGDLCRGGALQDRRHHALPARMGVRALRGHPARHLGGEPQILLPLPVSAGCGSRHPRAHPPVRLAQASQGVRIALPDLRQ